MTPLPHLWLGALLALWPTMPARRLTDEQPVLEPAPASAPPASAPPASELPPAAGLPVPAPGPVLGTSGSEATAVAPAADAPCDASPATRAPDPRCGETLDGRPPPSTPLTLPRAALAVPRLGARALFWPFVTASDFVEEHKLLDWMNALLTTDDGLIGVRPHLQYSTGFVSTAGLRFFGGERATFRHGVAGGVDAAASGDEGGGDRKQDGETVGLWGGAHVLEAAAHGPMSDKRNDCAARPAPPALFCTTTTTTTTIVVARR